jgi:uncharacterized protein DUF6600
MRKTVSLFPVLTLLAGLVFAFSSPALADDDPPGRVARLNYIQGSISFQPGGATDWTQANPNRPLTTGDNLWADKDSRGELHIGSTSIRLGAETGITFLNLNDRTVQIQLAQGSMSVHVRRLEGGDAFEIDTPNIAFTLERAGEYRVDVDPSGGSTNVTVRQGEGDATGGGSEYHMDSGDRGTFSGTDSLTYDGGQAGGPDDFDQWCASRDDREDRAASARYVSRDVIGYDDLDGSGEWRSVPDYGYVWFPASVAVGWAPYRFGHWVFIAPWGWTWVEDEPWGFAPFHYGRWAVFGGAWCWVPGPVVVRPVYAPALVVFVGGAHFGAGLSFGVGGGVAWFPLGPREVYVPPYRVSERYVQNVNVTNTTVNIVNVTNVYRNVNVTNVTYMHQNNVAAVTAVSHDTFVNARPVAAASVRVNTQQIQQAEVQRNFTVAPVRQSVVGASAPATVRPPQAVMQRQVVAKIAPAPPRAPIGGNAQGTVTQQGRGPIPQPQAQPPQQQTPARPGFQSFTPPGQQQTRTQPSSVQPSQPQQQQQTQSQPQLKQPTGQTLGQTPGRTPGQPQPNGQVPAKTNTTPPPPGQQTPNVRFAPPPQANEHTYQPHQFERPPTPPAPAPNAAPPKEQPKPQQESKKPENEKEKEKK